MDLEEETEEMVNSLEQKDITEMTDEDYEEKTEIQVEVTRQAYDTQIVAVSAYLESVEYDGETLYDFFSRDYDEVSTDDGIRSLYPIVASLSAGQTVGFEFLSIIELFSMALSDENTYKTVEAELEDTKEASVYEGVNREIYEKGGVALTSDTLRAKALEDQGNESAEYKVGTLPIVFWGLTAGFAAATVTSAIIYNSSKQLKTITETVNKVIYNAATSKVDKTIVIASLLEQRKNDVENLAALVNKHFNTTDSSVQSYMNTLANNIKKGDIMVAELKNNGTITKTEEVSKQVSVSNNLAKYMAIGMAVVTVIMTVVSTVMTCLDASKFYDTEYTPIPKYIVEESDITATNAKGKQVMLKNQTAYYKVVRCNRTAGDSSITKKNFEVMGDANDLNGDIGKQWLSLYSVKYENGLPILADSLLYKLDGDRVPDGYTTGIHEFGRESDKLPACDINSAKYLFPDKTPEIKVYFKRDTSIQSAGAAGSLFTAGSFAIGGGVGLVVGALFGGLVMSRRKKKPEIAHE